MPFIKITYGSSYNVSVQGVDYFEVDLDELDAMDVDNVWQGAVNNFMSDTRAEIVENEGD